MTPALVAVLLAAGPLAAAPLAAAPLAAAPLATAPLAAAPARDAVIGEVGAHVVARGESLVELARRYDVGFNAIAAANPRLDPFVPEVGARVVIPTAWIVPAAAEPGTLVVNLSEMRLYYSPGRGEPVVTFPVGVGMEASSTPLGRLRIVQKSVQPTWYPTRSIRAEDPTLPEAVPPGPDNPLGSHALRLSTGTHLIHGTNRPFGVGRKVTHGCVRLYPEDIARLYQLVGVGTPVAIVREPVKVGVRRGRVLVEVHDDDAVRLDLVEATVDLLEGRGLLLDVDPARLVRAIRARSGVPVDVTADPR